jgi:hypothetical protein
MLPFWAIWVPFAPQISLAHSGPHIGKFNLPAVMRKNIKKITIRIELSTTTKTTVCRYVNKISIQTRVNNIILTLTDTSAF